MLLNAFYQATILIYVINNDIQFDHLGKVASVNVLQESLVCFAKCSANDFERKAWGIFLLCISASQQVLRKKAEGYY